MALIISLKWKHRPSEFWNGYFGPYFGSIMIPIIGRLFNELPHLTTVTTRKKRKMLKKRMQATNKPVK